jgi:hypothetical protein
MHSIAQVPMTEPGLFKFTPPRTCWFRYQGEVDEHQVRRLFNQIKDAVGNQPFFYLTVDMTEFVKDTIASRRAGADIMATLPPRATAVVTPDWSKRVVAKLVFKGSELLAGKDRQWSAFFSDQEAANKWLATMTETLEQAAKRLAAAK